MNFGWGKILARMWKNLLAQFLNAIFLKLKFILNVVEFFSTSNPGRGKR